MYAGTESATGRAAMAPRYGGVFAPWPRDASRGSIALGTAPFAADQPTEAGDGPGDGGRSPTVARRPRDRVRAAMRPGASSPRPGPARLPSTRRTRESRGPGDPADPRTDPMSALSTALANRPRVRGREEG